MFWLSMKVNHCMIIILSSSTASGASPVTKVKQKPNLPQPSSMSITYSVGVKIIIHWHDECNSNFIPYQISKSSSHNIVVVVLCVMYVQHCSVATVDERYID